MKSAMMNLYLRNNIRSYLDSDSLAEVYSVDDGSVDTYQHKGIFLFKHTRKPYDREFYIYYSKSNYGYGRYIVITKVYDTVYKDTAYFKCYNI